MENLLEVAGVLDMVEFFKHALELFIECSRNIGMLVLILDDVLVIGNDMSLHLPNL